MAATSIHLTGAVTRLGARPLFGRRPTTESVHIAMRRAEVALLAQGNASPITLRDIALAYPSPDRAGVDLLFLDGDYASNLRAHRPGWHEGADGAARRTRWQLILPAA